VVYSKRFVATKMTSQIYLRLLKKKLITVVLDTDHEVHYRPVDKTRWVCSSYTTRIAEVENARKPGRAHPAAGYRLWISLAPVFLLALLSS
jgi:hypothetical protein